MDIRKNAFGIFCFAFFIKTNSDPVESLVLQEGDCVTTNENNTAFADLTLDPNSQVSFDKRINQDQGFGYSILSDCTFGDVCCLHPDTLVDTNKGMIPIKDVRKGDMVRDVNGNYIEVLNNIIFGKTNNFVQISKGALGPNVPSRDIYATEGHPLIYEGQEVTFGDIRSKGMASRKPLEFTNVYSIQTNVRTGVMMENLPVYTWGVEDWEDFKSKNDIFYMLQ